MKATSSTTSICRARFLGLTMIFIGFLGRRTSKIFKVKLLMPLALRRSSYAITWQLLTEVSYFAFLACTTSE